MPPRRPVKSTGPEPESPGPLILRYSPSASRHHGTPVPSAQPRHSASPSKCVMPSWLPSSSWTMVAGSKHSPHPEHLALLLGQIHNTLWIWERVPRRVAWAMATANRCLRMVGAVLVAVYFLAWGSDSYRQCSWDWLVPLGVVGAADINGCNTVVPSNPLFTRVRGISVLG